MKMNKKGFTLIELLAVIVILAIIALIATPIVMNVINSAQEEANERTLEAYAAQLELGYANAMLDSENKNDGDYQEDAVTFANENTNNVGEFTVAATNPIVWGTADENKLGVVKEVAVKFDNVDYCYVAGSGASKAACTTAGK